MSSTQTCSWSTTESIFINSGSTTFQISHLIYNPSLPCTTKIPGGIKKDMAVIFKGSVLPGGKAFTIDFSAGGDVAFHYKPQIGQYTCLNTYRNGNWEKEEQAPDKPYTMGGVFQIIVAINSEGYQVIVNGVNHCTFKHRIPLENVSTVTVHGNITIELIGFIDGQSSSSFFTDLQKIPKFRYTPLKISYPITNPALPYKGNIPGGIKKDMAIIIQGTVLPNANNFKIDFSAGDEIIFHYNPRFGNYTALNSFRNGSWETEESAPDKPFIKGGAFQIIVAIKSEAYVVTVNGLDHCTFKHRIPFEKVSTICVHGDVGIQLIGFIEKWGTA